MLRIKLVRSPIAAHWRNRRTIAALGLRKMQQTIEKEDTPSIRGMVHAVKEFLVVENVATGETEFDARTIRPHATRKRKKPPESH